MGCKYENLWKDPRLYTKDGFRISFLNMGALWNQFNLPHPPYRSWEISIKEFDVKKFTETIDKILNDFQSFEVLHKEAALLSRLIYRMKSKFRSDIGLKNMQKVNTALLNYLNMSIEKEFKQLKKYVDINNGSISLPSKQILEYILIKIQGLAKLMCRIESTAQTAAIFLKSRLHIGQSWNIALIAYGVISRIWILSRYIVKKTYAWYNKIHNYKRTFKQVGVAWIPDTYILPQNYSKWLGVPWINEDIEKLLMNLNCEKSIFNLIETNITVKKETKDESVLFKKENCDLEEMLSQISSQQTVTKKSTKDLAVKEELIDVEDSTIENLRPEVKQPMMQRNILIANQDCDLGEAVSRVSYEKSCQQSVAKEPSKQLAKTKKKNTCKNKNKKDKRSNLLHIASEKDLVRLLEADSCPGIEKLQWNILKKSIKKLLLKLTKKNTRDLNAKSFEKVKQHIKEWTSSKH